MLLLREKYSFQSVREKNWTRMEKSRPIVQFFFFFFLFMYKKSDMLLRCGNFRFIFFFFSMRRRWILFRLAPFGDWRLATNGILMHPNKSIHHNAIFLFFFLLSPLAPAYWIWKRERKKLSNVLHQPLRSYRRMEGGGEKKEKNDWTKLICGTRA